MVFRIGPPKRACGRGAFVLLEGWVGFGFPGSECRVVDASGVRLREREPTPA